MNRSVTRRRVSTRRATVPCASVACNSSSRLSEVTFNFELMTLSCSVRVFKTGDDFFVRGKWKWVGSGAGDAIASLRLGCIKRAVGAGEKAVGSLFRSQRRDACGHGYLHARRESAPVEIGDDGPQPVQDVDCS